MKSIDINNFYIKSLIRALKEYGLYEPIILKHLNYVNHNIEHGFESPSSYLDMIYRSICSGSDCLKVRNLGNTFWLVDKAYQNLIYYKLYKELTERINSYFKEYNIDKALDLITLSQEVTLKRDYVYVKGLIIQLHPTKINKIKLSEIIRKIYKF